MSKKHICLLLLIFVFVGVQITAAQDSVEFEGTIEDPDDLVPYEIELEEGDTITVTAEATSGNLDTYIGLLDPDGEVVIENDDIDTEGGNFDSQFEYEAEDDGVHTIVVTAYDGTGDYLLTIEGEFGEVTPLDPIRAGDDGGDDDGGDEEPTGDVIFEDTGEISDDEPDVEFELELSEGDVVTITVEALDPGLDPIVSVYNPDGDLIAENDDIDTEGRNYNSRVVIEAETDGEYIIVVTSYGRTEGEFQVIVQEGGDPSDTGVGADRPDLDGEELTRETEHFVLHYTLEGENATTEDFVDEAVDMMEFVWEAEIEEMGWHAPPTDNGAGGDDRFDVYLLELCSNQGGIYGYAQPEGSYGDNPSTDDVEELYAISSHMAIDNDFDDACFDNGTGDFLTTMAHEFNHAIQFGYDIRDAHNWYYESTATWMETQVAGEDEAATIYVAELYNSPEVCLGSVEGGLMYGTYLFIQSLADAYGEDVVQELWDNIAFEEGFAALEATLDAHDEDIPTAVARYHAQNVARAYPLAERFGATVRLDNTIDDTGTWTSTGDGVQELAVNYFWVDLDEGTYSAELSGDDGENFELFAIGINGDEAEVFALGDSGTFTTEGYDFVYLMVFNPEYDDDVEDCEFYSDYEIEIDESDDDVADVVWTFDASNFEELED
jgi:hypothetical protein